MSSLMGTRTSGWAAFSWTAGGSVSSKQSGKVLTFLWMTLFLLMGVAWGTASRWEELGMAGTMETGLAGLGRAGVALVMIAGRHSRWSSSVSWFLSLVLRLVVSGSCLWFL